jgi:hypothetical protein
MLEEFVALYLAEKDKNLEKQFREKIGVSNRKKQKSLVVRSGHTKSDKIRQPGRRP